VTVARTKTRSSEIRPELGGEALREGARRRGGSASRQLGVAAGASRSPDEGGVGVATVGARRSAPGRAAAAVREKGNSGGGLEEEEESGGSGSYTRQARVPGGATVILGVRVRIGTRGVDQAGGHGRRGRARVFSSLKRRRRRLCLGAFRS
jgi:hypothetical protein